MIQNNEFTSPENRFFYPPNNPIEYHESLDTAGLPAAEQLPGDEHYAVVKSPAGEVYAQALTREYQLPVGAVVLGMGGHARLEDRTAAAGLLTPDQFAVFEESCSYMPAEDGDAQVIVQVNPYPYTNVGTDPRFDKNAAAALPLGTPLHDFPERADNQERVEFRYRLLGFIKPDDTLIAPHESARPALIDYCVINRLKQNSLEETLLMDGLPLGGHLGGLLGSAEAASVYLRYFDAKHGTSYLTDQDPRYMERTFPQLSGTDYQEYKRLTDQMYHFLSHPRRSSTT